MSTIEIGQENWKSFIEEFNQKYNGKLAYIETTDNEGYRTAYSDSIAFEKIEMNKIDETHITFSVIAGEESEFKQFVDRIARIVFEDDLNDENYSSLLHIYSALGSGALIKFHKI